MSLRRCSYALLVVLLSEPIWISAATSPNIAVDDLFFIDSSHGWLSANDPDEILLRTSDGGQSWEQLPAPSNEHFRLLGFFDTRIGFGLRYLPDDQILICRTTDGGQTWSTVNSLAGQDVRISKLIFLSSDEAFIVGNKYGVQGWVAQISEGGKALHIRIDLSSELWLHSIRDIFGDGEDHLWIVGTQRLILHSADRGRTWERQYIDDADLSISIAAAGTAVPGGYAWIAVTSFRIYRTTDYGRHWIEVFNTKGREALNFDSISFSDTQHGCAVGDSSFVYCSNDGGKTWSRSKAFTNFGGSIFESKLILFGPSAGWAKVSTALYKTDDGGKNFTEILTTLHKAEIEMNRNMRATDAAINGPTELACDKNGFLYIVERVRGRLLRLNLKDGTVEVAVPEPEFGTHYASDYPHAVTTDGKGGVFIVDFNGRLRKLDANLEKITTLIPEMAKKFALPESMAFDATGRLLIADRSHKVFGFDPETARLETIAGGGSEGDGALATDAELRFPEGLAVNDRGDILVADYENCRIRKIDINTKIITTIGGTGQCASEGDDGPATRAALNYPSSIALDRNGNLFFVEGATNRVRRIDPSGMIKTYAGTGEKGFSGDGGRADKARLNNPSGLAVDGDGNLYIAEYVNNRIRRVDAQTQVITTLAGNGLPQRLNALK